MKLLHRPQVFSYFLFKKKNVVEENSSKVKLAPRLFTSEGETDKKTAMKNDVHGQR